MEIAGLAIGVPGVIGPLIQAGLNGYKIFSVIHNLNTDFNHYRQQLSVQRKLLKDRVENLKCRVGKDFATDKLLDEFKGDQERLTLVIKTLTRMAYLFADVRQLDTLYGMKTATFSDSTMSDQGSATHKSSSFSKMFRRIRSSSKHNTPDAPNAIDSNTQALENLKIDLDLGEGFIASLPVAEQFNRIVSSYDKAKWVFTDREKLQALVEDLKQYNSDLKNLTENYLFTIGDIGSHELPSTQNTEILFMVPFPENHGFVGKSEISKWIKDRPQFQGRVALYGLGGIGKTQGILEFAYQYEGARSVF